MANSARIVELERLIRHHQERYYNGIAEIADTEFDRWWDELRQIDPYNTLLRQIGADSDPHGVKRRHIIYMQSLDKASDPEGFRRWAQRVKRKVAKAAIDKMGFRHWAQRVERPRYIVQYKMDGAGIELQYERGRFLLAATRGDGLVGDDVSANTRRMQNFVPKVAANFSGGVRGEVIMLRSVHRARYSEKANCRNTSVGLMRRKDGVGSDDLIIVVYDVRQQDEQQDAAPQNAKQQDAAQQDATQLFADQMTKLEWLRQQGFRVVETHIYEDVEAIVSYRDKVMLLREGLDFDIDGLVVKAPEIDIEDMRRARPENQIAFKFILEEQVTTVLMVEWSASGANYTPVAIVDPVQLAGTTVKRASMANPRLVREMQLRIGSRVAVSKRGEIIPKIERLVENPPDSSPISFPTHCDSCGSQLIDEDTRLYCPNNICPRRRLHRIRRWIVMLDIQDFGEKLIQRLFDNGRVTEIADLYSLQQEDITQIEKQGERSATKILRNLYAANEISLERFIAGFQIEDIGELIIAKVVKGGFDTLKRLHAADPAQLAKVKGIGSITAEAISSGVQALYEEMQAVLHTGRIKIVRVQPHQRAGGRTGLSFCFSGRLLGMKRSEAQALARQQGAIIKNSVVRGLDYLVTNEPAASSTKLRQADAFGVRVIDEAAFVTLAKAELTKTEPEDR